MTTSTISSRGGGHQRASRWRRTGRLGLLPLAALVVVGGADQLTAASGADTDTAPSATANDHGAGDDMSPDDRATAMQATASFQDVATAESAGYTSSIDTLGCFEDPANGGMGLHYISEGLLDATLDATEPEALVYELGPDGEPIGLVAHEYIVPVEAWTSPNPPQLFGRELHQHPTLPLFVLHTWLWKDNPRGIFEDWNPAIRPCPSGVPVFGVDLPEPATDS